MRSNGKNAIVETLERRSQAHRRSPSDLIDRNGCHGLGGPCGRRHYQGTKSIYRGVRGRGTSEAIVIRSELNQRSEFQRVSCRLVAARMQMAMSRSRGRKTGGRRRVGTDVMYRRRYVFRMQSSEWNARKEASRRVAPERGRAVHKFSALPSMLFRRWNFDWTFARRSFSIFLTGFS